MNSPEIPHIDGPLVDNAVSLWGEGKLVAIPTETVYGLAADATNGEAVARIYVVKGRPLFNPLIVHVADVATAKQYVEWNDTAEMLANQFWPGPLTLVLKRRMDCPVSELVSAGGDTLAIRIPSHPVTQQLLRAFGGGIAAPSANRSGRVSPTTADHVREEFGECIPLIIDGGSCKVGLESTVLDVSGSRAVILRPGSITAEMLEAVISFPDGGRSEAVLRIHPPLHSRIEEGGLKSPGLLESHYAPSIPVRLHAAEVVAEEALLAFGPAPLIGAANTLNLSPSGDLIEAAANLFAYLRALDDPHYRAIAVMPIPATSIGVAINDRLKRAGAPK